MAIDVSEQSLLSTINDRFKHLVKERHDYPGVSLDLTFTKGPADADGCNWDVEVEFLTDADLGWMTETAQQNCVTMAEEVIAEIRTKYNLE